MATPSPSLKRKGEHDTVEKQTYTAITYKLPESVTIVDHTTLQYILNMVNIIAKREGVKISPQEGMVPYIITPIIDPNRASQKGPKGYHLLFKFPAGTSLSEEMSMQIQTLPHVRLMSIPRWIHDPHEQKWALEIYSHQEVPNEYSVPTSTLTFTQCVHRQMDLDLGWQQRPRKRVRRNKTQGLWARFVPLPGTDEEEDSMDQSGDD